MSVISSQESPEKKSQVDAVEQPPQDLKLVQAINRSINKATPYQQPDLEAVQYTDKGGPISAEPINFFQN